MSRSRGGEVHDVLAVDQDRALVDVLETSEHPQARRLAAAGRADQDEELAVLYLEVEAVDCGPLALRVDPCRFFEGHGGHESSLPTALSRVSKHYSLVAPASMPLTSVRCANRNTISTGAIAMITAIARSGRWSTTTLVPAE